MHKRVTITLPEETLRLVQERVAEGHASSVSAFIAAATRREVKKESVADIAADIMRETGNYPTAEDEAWARRALGLSS